MWYQLLLISILVSTAADAVFRIPLRKLPRTQQHPVKNNPIQHRYKYDKRHIPKHLTNYLNNQYYAIIAIGKPKQYFTVQIDTGSSITWVPSIHCRESSSGCWIHRKYKSGKSSTYKYNGLVYIINYSNQVYVAGYFSIDNIWFEKKKKVREQFFLECVRDSGVPFKETMFDGVLALSSYNHTTSVFHTMMEQNMFTTLIFSVYLNRDPNSLDGGEILFGDSNLNYYNESLTHFPIMRRNTSSWLIEMGLVKMKNSTFCTEGCLASIDTGTSYIGVPNGNLLKIKQILGIPETQSYVYCNQAHHFPPIIFVLHGKEFTLTPEDYLEKPFDANPGICLLRFVMITLESIQPTWILGQTFIGKYYTVFDGANFTVGFALAVHKP